MPMYKISYGDAVIKGGMFLKSQSKQSNTVNYQDGKGEFFRHLSTFSDKSTIKRCLIESIENAQKYIFFTSFLIQDQQIIESLIKAVRRLKGHVYVITTLKKNDFDAVSSLESQQDRQEWDFEAHMDCVKYLAQNGIFVKARKDCHAKFAVFDDRYAVITSANSVATCFEDTKQESGHIRGANPENGVFIDIKPEVLRIANFFRAIWRGAYNYYIKPDKNFRNVGESSTEIMPICCKEPSSPSDNGQVIWTAPDDFRILNSMTDMIDSAEKEIKISTYVLKGMTDHIISRKLLKAAERDVKIELLVRGMTRKDHLESCYHLKQSIGENIDIRADFYNHSKALVVDDKEAMILSANLDAQHGLDSSVEVGFMSKNIEFVNSVSNFLDRLKAGCRLELVCDPSQSQIAEDFSTIHEPIITGDDITINVRKNQQNHIKKLIEELTNKLVKITDLNQGGNQKYRLFTDSITVDFSKNGQNQLFADNIRRDLNTEHLHFKQVLPKSTITINAQ